jgi:SAM-dependent methyltransferase
VSEKFDATWLELREGVDHRSRAVELVPPLREWWTMHGCSSVLDLGCGTGSNLRYLAPRLSTPQRWTLLDHDAELLARIEAPGGDVEVDTLRGHLAREGLAEVSRAELVTASALLDLVSRSWLSALVDACTDAGCGALFALSYDGTIEWSTSEDPSRAEDALDAVMREALNAHQLRDKGVGPALGPAAGRIAEELFRGRGYRTWLAPSPWRLGPAESALAVALVAGWATAAAEERPDQADAVRRWAARRGAWVADSTAEQDFALLVGHVDLLALPALATSERS